MRITFSSSLLALVATAAGLRILTPAIDQKVPQDDSITVRWQAVSTDPDTMDIYLVNQNVYPNTQELVASNVDTSLGKYTIKAKDVGDVDTGRGYQVNFVSTENGGILAQSSEFRVTPSKAASASSSGKETSTASEIDFYAFYFCVLDYEFDFCFSYFFCDSFFYFFERYSLLHQCVYLYHFSFIYCFTYFYFCPYIIFYDERLYQCVHLSIFQFVDFNPFKFKHYLVILFPVYIFPIIIIIYVLLIYVSHSIFYKHR
ncbi:hypothetical protein N7528_002365 [Penicillium herquei]|nr:hypothetical protein N7528_002365 [Penicillium herquei]